MKKKLTPGQIEYRRVIAHVEAVRTAEKLLNNLQCEECRESTVLKDWWNFAKQVADAKEKRRVFTINLWDQMEVAVKHADSVEDAESVKEAYEDKMREVSVMEQDTLDMLAKAKATSQKHYEMGMEELAELIAEYEELLNQ